MATARIVLRLLVLASAAYGQEIPPGPYVSSLSASSRALLVEPAAVVLPTPRTGCPHEQAGLLTWHEASTWPSGELPTAGANVTLPAASRVLLSSSLVGTLGLLIIPAGSELIIGEGIAGSPIALQAVGVIVRGALRAGSATCRLESPVGITLHGARPATAAARAAQPPWFKGIYVEGGTLDLHGKHYHRTWARLARSVEPGDDVVLLQAAVNWEVGQRIVLVTTALKDARDWHRNEEATIAELLLPASGLPDGVGAAVRLTAPAQYAHEANDGYQGEVGLLSRTISVSGASEDSEPTDTLPVACAASRTVLGSSTVPCAHSFLTGYGGHILITGSGAVGRVSGVELLRMGQTNVLGRYPFHLHLLGDEGAHSYLRDSSVYHSYYRCASLHGTNYATLSQNVAYDVIGYCFYLEDGVEEYNSIEFNLAAFVHFLGAPARSTNQWIESTAQVHARMAACMQYAHVTGPSVDRGCAAV